MLTFKIPSQKRVFFLFLTLLYPASILAAPLEDIVLSPGDGSVIATINLSGPVTNVRYSPAKKGTTLSILLEKVPTGASQEEWLDNEVLASPPSNLIPSFTVKTNLKNIQPKLIVEFDREAEYLVQMGKDRRSIVITIKIDRTVPKFNGSLPELPEVAPVSSKASEIEQKAAAFMLAGRNSLAVGDNFAAIDSFNKLLLLPPNSYTQDGQEWVGVARERAGQLDKAKLELDLYLKLYDDPEDVKRIKLRLASLGSKPPKSPSVTADSKAGKKKPSQNLVYGSLSMHYYHGASKTDVVDTASTFSTALSQTSFTNVDQSALLSTVFITERFISDQYDNRLVFQDTGYTNFLPGQTSKNRLGTAYFELKDKYTDYSFRVGRQSSSGGGVMGRFDGATFGIGITPSIRLKAVGGKLSDYPVESRPVFYGASMEMGPVTLYAINQSSDDIIERKAVGTEARYFETNKTAFLVLDYDTMFSALNVAMLQGSYNPNPERTYSFFFDHRRTPYLSTRNALFGAYTNSLADLLLFMTEEQIRALAADRTGTSDLAQIGLTQQVSTKWQIGGDLRVSRYGAMPESGAPFFDPNAPPPVEGYLPASPDSGNDWAISQQLIGSNLYSTRDVTVFNLSLMGSPLYRGQSFYMYSRGNLTDKWSLDFSLQYYRQVYESGMLMTRVMPMLRTAYHIKQSLSFDFDAGLEVTHTEYLSQLTDGQRQFYSVGFRWDF